MSDPVTHCTHTYTRTHTHTHTDTHRHEHELNKADRSLRIVRAELDTPTPTITQVGLCCAGECAPPAGPAHPCDALPPRLR